MASRTRTFGRNRRLAYERLEDRCLLTNLALNPARSGYPHPLESDRGWGGGTDQWDIVDGLQTYPEWANGLAFTGGHTGDWSSGGWVEPAGWRQATIDFGALTQFDKVVIWHHGHNHVPAAADLDYWDGSMWQDIVASRVFGAYEAGQAGATSDEYTFTTVTGSKIRYSFDNSGANVLGTPIVHGWIYEFEVFAGNQADLTGVFSTVPATVTAGTNIQVSIDVTNSGQAGVSGSIDVGFYLSTDDTLDAGDMRIGTSTIQSGIPVGQTVQLPTSVTVPDSVAGGVYRLIAKVDDANVINEGTNEDNNTAVSDQVVIRRLSGAEWVNAFPGSRSLDDLSPAFAANVRRFINAVETGGATVNITSTLRPPERAYLMHWSWRIVNENYPANNVNPMNGVYIEWWHGDQNSSKRAAREMVSQFGMTSLSVPPALNSNHTLGLAIDMAIGWQGRLTVVDGNGAVRTIQGGPRTSTNRDLIEIAATFGVIHFIDANRDRNHWSINGR